MLLSGLERAAYGSGEQCTVEGWRIRFGTVAVCCGGWHAHKLDFPAAELLWLSVKCVWILTRSSAGDWLGRLWTARSWAVVFSLRPDCRHYITSHLGVLLPHCPFIQLSFKLWSEWTFPPLSCSLSATWWRAQEKQRMHTHRLAETEVFLLKLKSPEVLQWARDVVQTGNACMNTCMVTLGLSLSTTQPGEQYTPVIPELRS